MLGLLCPQPRGPVRAQREEVAGLNVLCVHVTQGGRRESRHLTRAAKLLCRAGIRRVLPHRGGLPIPVGMTLVDALPLYRAMADRLVLTFLEQNNIPPEQTTVVLQGEYPDSDLTAAACRLCPVVRQIQIDTKRGGEAVQRRLYREFGVAVGPLRPGERRLRVRFSGLADEEELRLCEDVELAGLEVDVPGIVLPEELERLPILCALWQAGQIGLQRFEIAGPERTNKSLDIRHNG